jgi:hypothetical protein
MQITMQARVQEGTEAKQDERKQEEVPEGEPQADRSQHHPWRP